MARLRWRRVYRTESTGVRYPVYILSKDGLDVAEAALTGRRGVDDYPWEWYTLNYFGQMASGVLDTLRSCKEHAEAIFQS